MLDLHPLAGKAPQCGRQGGVEAHRLFQQTVDSRADPVFIEATGPEDAGGLRRSSLHTCRDK